MTVGELIETLQKYPAHYKVMLLSEKGEDNFVVVSANLEEGKVYLG